MKIKVYKWDRVPVTSSWMGADPVTQEAFFF